MSIVIWALSTYPQNEPQIAADLEGNKAALARRLTDAATPDAERADLAAELEALETPEAA